MACSGFACIGNTAKRRHRPLSRAEHTPSHSRPNRAEGSQDWIEETLGLAQGRHLPVVSRTDLYNRAEDNLVGARAVREIWSVLAPCKCMVLQRDLARNDIVRVPVSSLCHHKRREDCCVGVSGPPERDEPLLHPSSKGRDISVAACTALGVCPAFQRSPLEHYPRPVPAARAD